jgi:drug/metabolite transporter (DMT)-like permease
MYLIRHNSASSVASLFYLVPPATALEAYFLFGERLGGWAILGMGLAVVGVALVVRR